MFIIVLMMLETNHIKTAALVFVAWVCTCIFVWKLVIESPKTVDCDDVSERLIYKALIAWKDGDFARVLVILQQCDLREIEDFTVEIEKRFGPEEARLVGKLLS